RPLNEVLSRKRRICIVPHGPLFNLPFAALLADNNEFLLTRAEITYAPSISILAAVTKQVNPPLRRLSVFADPLPDGQWSLPGARDEANTIQSAPFDVEAHLGAEVTPAAVLNAAKTTDILHLACHAEFDENHPLLSALLLADESGEPGRLEAHAIYNAE